MSKSKYTAPKTKRRATTRTGGANARRGTTARTKAPPPTREEVAKSLGDDDARQVVAHPGSRLHEAIYALGVAALASDALVKDEKDEAFALGMMLRALRLDLQDIHHTLYVPITTSPLPPAIVAIGNATDEIQNIYDDLEVIGIAIKSKGEVRGYEDEELIQCWGSLSRVQTRLLVIQGALNAEFTTARTALLGKAVSS